MAGVMSRARRGARQGWILYLCAPFVGCILDGGSARAQTPASSPAGSTAPQPARSEKSALDVEDRLRRLEALVGQQADQMRQLSEENRVLTNEVRTRKNASADPRVEPAQVEAGSTPALPSPTLPAETLDEIAASPPDAPSTPVTDDESGIRGLYDVPSSYSALLESGNDAISGIDTSSANRSFITGRYDQGYVLVAPNDKQITPFALKLNVTNQLRYTGFARSVATWTDSSGRVLPVFNRSYFALNRNWFSFTGFAFSPRLQFNATVFSTSTLNQTVAMGTVTYTFSKALSVASGYYKVPGTREWIESARYTLGADRTMANTFFRPSISPGVWANGEPFDGFFYYAGIFNDFNSTSNGAERVNNNMTYSGNIWWEPLGPFGPGFADEEYHDRLVVRTGGSLTYQRSRREPDLQLGQTNPENTILRLSDGTPLFQPGALAPGVTLTGADIALFSYDLAFKYRGFSLSGEYYGRWIYGLDGHGGPVPHSELNIFDTGGLAQLSYAVVPRQLEVFARTSGVFGPFGDGSEYGGGANWYAFSTRNVRMTFEAKRINHSPANNLLYGYFAGESGMLYQLQLLTDF
jgi:hypothetical protein